jgi:hypothetical protein
MKEAGWRERESGRVMKVFLKREVFGGMEPKGHTAI